jgi:acyl-CoA thioester hydrolase
MAFPYPLPELDLAAPFDRHRAQVRGDWIDANGHMNVAYYAMAFDHGLDTFSEQLGIAWPYVEHRLGMTFVRESHILYERELRAGDPLRVTTQILDHDAKRMHLFQSMYHGDEGWLAAVTELMVVNIDFATRRSAPWLPETLRRLAAMAAAHAALPRPGQAGRIIAIRGTRAR